MTTPRPTNAQSLEDPSTNKNLQSGMEAKAALTLDQKLKAFDPLVHGGEFGASDCGDTN